MKRLSFDSLQGKTCVVTGGAGVIGRSLCEGLAGTGVHIAVVGRTKEPVEQFAAQLRSGYGIRAAGVEGNVTDKESLLRAKSEINAALGPIDLLINCAGGNNPAATTKAPFLDKEGTNIMQSFFGLDAEAFKEVYDLNFLGTVLPTMVFSSDMVERGRGAVLNISSISSFHPLTKIPAYSAAKCSVNNFTEWLAVHLAKTNIRVNAIAPGFFLTKQNRFLLTDEATGALTERGRSIIAGTPMGTFGEPDDLQGAALFLLSDLSKFMTGVIIPVDGGFNAFSGV
jgi:NAD(P)-dependent dehydrogenase (short-subunit alcohol dehydrogenase family)